MKHPTPLFRTALVTGASSGLGAAIGTALKAQGIQVWGTSRKTAGPGDKDPMLLQLDLTDIDSVHRFCVQLEELPPIDILINNAGFGVFGPFSTIQERDIQEQIAVMLEGPIVLARALLPGMLARGRGCIVNVSSLAARLPLPSMTLYNTSKAALSAFSRCLMTETEGTGVSVIDFQPGDLKTPFNDRMRRNGGCDIVWSRLDENLISAPHPDYAAQLLVRNILKQTHGTLTAGSFLQAKLAPLAQYVLPDWMMRRILRYYFNA